MFKTILLIAVCVAAFAMWKRADSKSSRTPAQVGKSDGSTLLITYSDPNDLLSQLRNVKAGQKFDLRCTGPARVTESSNVQCSDKAAVAALIERKNREVAELNQALQAEFKRIQQVP
jgi:hypothetical protein